MSRDGGSDGGDGGSGLTPTAPPGSAPAPPRLPRPAGTVRRRVVRTASLTLLLLGLLGYYAAASVLVQDLDQPPWWAWLWLAVPATVASWLVLPLGR